MAYKVCNDASLDYEDQVPAGCAPDAIKLFVGNIPRGYNETQLLPLFEVFGPVVDLAIVRDKATHVSKGSAFLWFRERADAEQAILYLNLKGVLPGGDPGSPRGGRPLEVRRARPRQQATQQQRLTNPSVIPITPVQPPCIPHPAALPDGDMVVESFAVDLSTPLFSVAVANLYSLQTMSGAAVVMSPGCDSTSILLSIMGNQEQVQSAVWMLVVLLNVQPDSSTGKAGIA